MFSHKLNLSKPVHLVSLSRSECNRDFSGFDDTYHARLGVSVVPTPAGDILFFSDPRSQNEPSSQILFLVLCKNLGAWELSLNSSRAW